LVKLSSEAAHVYGTARALADRLIAQGGSEPFWARHCRCKEVEFQAVAEFQGAALARELAEKELKGFGEVLARFSQAERICNEAIVAQSSFLKDYPGFPVSGGAVVPEAGQMGRDGSFHLNALLDAIKTDLGAVKHDNDNVYYESVARADELAPLDRVCAVRAAPMTLRDLIPAEYAEEARSIRADLESTLLDEHRLSAAEQEKIALESAQHADCPDSGGQEQQGWKKGVWGLGNLLGNISRARLSFLSPAKSASASTVDPASDMPSALAPSPAQAAEDIVGQMGLPGTEEKDDGVQTPAEGQELSSPAKSKCDAITIPADVVDDMSLADLRTIKSAARPPTPCLVRNPKKESKATPPRLPLQQKPDNFAEETIPLIQRLLARGAVPPSTTKENQSTPASQGKSPAGKEPADPQSPPLKRQKLLFDVVNLTDSSQ